MMVKSYVDITLQFKKAPRIIYESVATIGDPIILKDIVIENLFGELIMSNKLIYVRYFTNTTEKATP